MRAFIFVVVLLLTQACKKPAPPPPVVPTPEPEPVAAVVAEPVASLEEPDAGEDTFIDIAPVDAGQSGMATFFITTDPPDASVFVNHVSLGHSPLFVKVPSRSPWGVIAEMPGYQSAEETVWPKPNQPVNIALRLVPVVADAGPAATGLVSVFIDSFPTGAYVLIDREDAGMTPLSTHVTAQPHDVIVLYAGYLRGFDFIDAGAGETKRIFLKLVPGF